MKTLKSKKSKILLCSIAVVLTICLLSTTLLACDKSVVSVTPDEVFFVNDLQKNPSQEEIAKITKEGETIVSIKEMLETTGWSIDNSADIKNIAAGIYALAVTNYGNLTQTVYMLMTDATVDVKGSRLGDIQVGVKSTYSDWIGKNGKFSQTISGVTKLQGLGDLGDDIKSRFGYNIQSFTNDNFYAFRRGKDGYANFYGKENADCYKYIMGAQQEFPTKYKNKGNEVNSFYITAPEKDDESSDTSAPREYAWSPLNRYQDEEIKIADSIPYYTGDFGASFANYDFSRPEYLDDATSVTYDAVNDIYTINIVVAEEYVDKACEFAKGCLVRDTKDYIALRNAVYTECTNVIEVYGSGIIKSIQKIETIASSEECNVLGGGLFWGTCKGGSTTNRAIVAFSYSDYDTDALRLAALYFPELSNKSYFQSAKMDTSFALDLSNYPTFSEYKPTVNTELCDLFNNITKETEKETGKETTEK